MPTSHPIYLYLHDTLVDEVWTSITREGITQEQIKEVGGKLEVKAKLGFGQLIKHLITDLSAEADTEGHVTRSRTLSYPVSFRALFLSELIDDTATKPTADLPCGTFVDLKCDFCRLFQIPTLADFLRFQALVSLANQRADDDSDSEGFSLDTMIADFDRITVLKKALAYSWFLAGQDGQESAVAPLIREIEAEVTHVMAFSQDDQVLLVASPKNFPNVLVVSFLDEKYLRRDLVGCTGTRDINIFGKITRRREASTGGEVVAIQPITITLL